MPSERDTLVARVLGSLNAIMGGDRVAAHEWLNAHNTAFDDTPHNKMQTKQGLKEVLNYLEARRYRL